MDPTEVANVPKGPHPWETALTVVSGWGDARKAKSMTNLAARSMRALPAAPPCLLNACSRVARLLHFLPAMQVHRSMTIFEWLQFDAWMSGSV